MSDQVTFAQTLQFTTNVKMLLQQMGSKLQSTVMQGQHTGQGAVPVEQIGVTSAQERTTRHGDTPIIDTPHARRWVFPTDYEWGDMVDKQDIVRTLIDPRSNYTQAGVAALGRQIDDTIITAFDATSTVGASTGGGDTTTEPFSTTTFSLDGNAGTGSQTAVGANGNGNLALAGLQGAWEALVAAEVDPDREEIYAVIGPSQWNALITEAGAASSNIISSSDYVDSRPLLTAKIPSLLGFNFVISNRLPVDANSVRKCFVYAKSGMHLGKWNDIEVKADVRPDKGFNWQLYARMSIGATRLEQGRVIRLFCDEA